MRVDAHQHFWDPARGDYVWMDALTGAAARTLARPILPPELEPILARHNIQRSVLVQAAPSEAEGDFLLSLAEQHDFIAGAVIWLDMQSQGFGQKLEQARKHPNFLGIRPMIQDIPDPDWMSGRSVKAAFALLEQSETCFDFLIRWHQLPATLGVLAEFPKLRAVIDHIAKPDIKARQLSPWCDWMRQAASHHGVYCKLSGMITEADASSWTPADLAPFIEHALACFGPERSMFGSDWPVCTLAGSYERVLAALELNLDAATLDRLAQARIFGGTAREFYRLP